MNYIQIYTAYNGKHRRIMVHPPFFAGNEHYILKNINGGLQFTRPTIDYNGKVLKATLQPPHNNQFAFQVSADYPMGKFIIDEHESNEDKIVVYFKTPDVENI